MPGIAKRATLLIIDPQNDFMGNADGTPYDTDEGRAALPVSGAVYDMQRLARFIDGAQGDGTIGKIIVTLDTHEVVGTHLSDIGHPGFWMDAAGNHPPPFTLITRADVESRVWRPYIEGFGARVHDYFSRAKTQMIWPPHCLDGTWGHQVLESLQASIKNWQTATGGEVEYVRKGMNPLTEQYGVFEAAVPDPDDKETQFNVKLLAKLAAAPQVVVAGEALDYCVKASVEQAAAVLPTDALHKFVLLTDCMSPVTIAGDNTVGAEFLADMQNRGVLLTRTA